MKRFSIDYESVLNLLERTPVFQGLLSEDLAKIGSCISARSFEVGETLGDFGDVVDEFWIVMDGTLATFYNDEHGRMIRLASLAPFDHLGEVAMIEKSPRPIRVMAKCAGAILVIPNEDFLAFVDAYPVLMRNLFRTISIRYKESLGARIRGIPSGRLGIVAHSRQSRILVARMISRLAAHGERLHVMVEDAVSIRNQVPWPDKISPVELKSSDLPVISRPILRDGMVLVDGGMLDNLPADVLANCGCDFIVGVDVSRRMNCEFAGNRPDTPTRLMKNAGALETLMRIFESQSHDIRAVRSQSIDFWITPDTSPFSLADFYRSQEIAAVGEQTARKILPELQQKLADFERRLDSSASM